MRSGLRFLLVATAMIGCSASLDKNMTPERGDGSVAVRDAQIDSGNAQVDSGVICLEGGSSLVPEARACSADSDCSVISSHGCCSTTSLGVATARKQMYWACLPPSCSETQYECPGGEDLFTDSGHITGLDSRFFPTVRQGATVSCVQGLCTTDFQAVDAGAAPQ